MDNSWEEDVPYQIWGHVHWTVKLQYIIRALERYPFHIESRCHIHGQPMVGRASVAEWLRHRSHATRPLTSSPRRFESCLDDVTV
jgi:hypothetical protein